MAKQRDPNIDFGFHATIPRVVRTGYEKLTPVQKWLYVCLKDLCGEHGTCYRALRVLAEETGISTGMLSESIRSLHEAGLIHAEKKRRSLNPTAKEVWHITIIDIWQANAKAHPTKRSHSEQSTENVHCVNNNVHSVNNDMPERSPGEQKRSLCETEEGSLSSINNEAISSEAVGKASLPNDAAPAAKVTDLQKWKEESGKHEAVKFSDNQQALGNDDFDTDAYEREVIGMFMHAGEEDNTPTQKREAVKPSKHTAVSSAEPVVEGPQVPAASSPPASTQQAAPGDEQREVVAYLMNPTPPMALTARQIKAQTEKREKELWTIIERERHTKYTRTQRALYDNREGMKCLVEDDITDEMLVKALQAMDKYQCKNFTVLKFYGWLPNLTADDSPPAQQNGKITHNEDETELGVSGLPRLNPRRDTRYA